MKSPHGIARLRRVMIASAVLLPVVAGARSASAVTMIVQAPSAATTPFQTVSIRERAAISSSDLPDIGQHASIALNSAGNPVIAYYDADRNTTASATGPYGNGDLKLMVCGNPTCAAGNTVTVVDRGRISTDDVGRGASLALDGRGFPVISYLDRASGLKLARCSDPTCTRLRIQVAEARSFTEFGNTSLVLDSSGLPVISYSVQGQISLVRCRNANCDPKATVTGGSGPVVSSRFVDLGTDNALVLDMKGNPVISYYHAARSDLRVVHCTLADCSDRTLNIQTVDQTGDVGQFSALRLIDVFDIRTGAVTSQRPFVSYYDATNGDLKAAYCGDPNCAQGNSISTLDTAGDVGRFTSMPKGQKGALAIGFYDATKRTLKLAICDPGSPYAKTPTVPCQETDRNTVTTVDAAGELPAPGTADVGKFNSLVLDARGNPVISYYDATNRTLKLAWK